MDSDHSESEFYYPDEVEKFSDKENIGSQRKENQQKAQFTMASVQKKHGEKNRIRPTRLEKILSWGGRGQENWRNTGRRA